MKDKKCKTKDCKGMVNSHLSKSGLCNKCSLKDYRDKHRTQLKKYSKEYWAENKDNYLEDNRKRSNVFNKKHNKRLRELSRTYYKKDPEKFKEHNKQYYRNHKEERDEYNLNYHNQRYREDEGFRIRKLLGGALRRVITLYIKTGRISNPMAKYGINWVGIMKVLTPIPKPRSAYDVDHIIPLYKFDLTNIEQIQIAFAPENHRWLLRKDNQTRERPNTRRKKD